MAKTAAHAAHGTARADSARTERQIARRLAALRREQGWTLEELARRTDISRASLSRIERCELSPTASMLTTLCGQYGWTLSRLMANAEQGSPSIIRRQEQTVWKDPETGYTRRILSPPDRQRKGEMVEIMIPAGASVTVAGYAAPTLEHHLWVLSGTLDLHLDGSSFRLASGDCARFVISGACTFTCRGRRPVRYLTSLVHP
ncbi:MAG: helix-turn-helix domain-containing protein [Terriglobales bacterium]